MRYIVLTLLSILLEISSIYAQSIRKSMLKVRLEDNSPIVVSIDDRRYDKSGRSLTIGDLPPGRHWLQVYEYLAYRDKEGGHAKLLYSGSIRVKRGMITDAVISPERGRIKTSRYDMVTVPDGNRKYDKKDKHNKSESIGSLNQRALDDLQSRVASLNTDTDRLKLMKSELEGKNYSSFQVRSLVQMLSFESSRLDFAKWAYQKVTDKSNYGKLEDQFSIGSTRNDFNEYLAQNQAGD